MPRQVQETVQENLRNPLIVSSRCRKCRIFKHLKLSSETLVVKVKNVGIVVERQVLRIAVASEQVDDPLLLFGSQQPFAVMVAVVVAVTAQVLLHTIA